MGLSRIEDLFEKIALYKSSIVYFSKVRKQKLFFTVFKVRLEEFLSKISRDVSEGLSISDS